MSELFQNKNIFVNLTYRCNAFCKKCMTRYHVNCGKEMSKELIHIIALKMGNANYAGVISVGTGEPVLYPDLSYFINEMLNINPLIRLRFLTNGMALHPDLPDIYFSDRCTWGVTMDGFYQNSLRNLQENVSIEHVKENVINIVKKYGASKLYLNFTLNNANYRDLPDFCRFAVSLGIHDIYATELKIYKGYEHDLLPYRLHREKDFYSYFEEAKKILQCAGISDHGIDIDFIHNRDSCFRADHAAPIIDVDGKLSFCSGREDIYIGNIQDNDIEHKWKALRTKLNQDSSSWCSACHDKVLEGGFYSLPKTIRRTEKLK